MNIEVTYMVTDLSDGFRQYERTFSVPNYRTLRSLLSAVDAACMDIEASRNVTALPEVKRVVNENP
jgi:hypothetical protein